VRCPGPPQGPNVSTCRSANRTGHAGNPKSRMVQVPRPKSCSRMKPVHRCTNSVWHLDALGAASTAPNVQPSAGVCDATLPPVRLAWVPGSHPLTLREEAHQGMLPGPRRRAQIVPG